MSEWRYFTVYAGDDKEPIDHAIRARERYGETQSYRGNLIKGYALALCGTPVSRTRTIKPRQPICDLCQLILDTMPSLKANEPIAI